MNQTHYPMLENQTKQCREYKKRKDFQKKDAFSTHFKLGDDDNLAESSNIEVDKFKNDRFIRQEMRERMFRTINSYWKQNVPGTYTNLKNNQPFE